jgi:hypothetical protein
MVSQIRDRTASRTTAWTAAELLKIADDEVVP